jgi:hypothetical protein
MVRYFGKVAATELKLWHRGHIQWHDVPSEIHTNLPVGPKIDRGTGRHADTQDCDLISLHCTFRNMKAMIVLRIFGTRCRHLHTGNRGP